MYIYISKNVGCDHKYEEISADGCSSKIHVLLHGGWWSLKERERRRRRRRKWRDMLVGYLKAYASSCARSLLHASFRIFFVGHCR